MEPASASPPDGGLSRQEVDLLTQRIVQTLMRSYEPGRDRRITPENVYQPAIVAGRQELEEFQLKLLLPGSRVEGLAHLDHCLAELRAGRHVLFLPEHRGNLDVPSFNALLRREQPRYHVILERLIYIAGRKLNESSDFIKMFTEKYARLVIVPKRDFPKAKAEESPQERQEREAFEQYAARINRAAFREMIRMKKAGFIFVLFPLGGRYKAFAENVPVRETASYLDSFDTAYPISMEGNTLPPLPRMEDERPEQARVIFRVGAPLDCKTFLAEQRARYEAARREGSVPDTVDYEQFTVERIMAMLEALRTQSSA